MFRFKNALVTISGNHYIQRLLEKNVKTSQYLMGIGSGAVVQHSGEETIFQALKQKVQPPYCIFDVGSNKGQFLKLILENIETDEFQIHCFEPCHETFKMLVKSSRADERIRLNNIGIAKGKGKAPLYYNKVGSGLASLTQRKLDHFKIYFNQSEEVFVDTIDHYCTKNGINHIHLLKIDIEGHELDALSGARKLFDANAIDIVTFEFGGCNIDTRTFFRDFWYFFLDLDFTVYRITPSGFLYPLNGYREIDEQFRTINYIAIANTRNNKTK